MATTELIDIKKLHLDLSNFRTVPQSDEPSAVAAIISIKPSKFWGVLSSLLNDGWHLNENIIVLKGSKKSSPLTVMEGNRRLAALKMIYKIVKIENIDIPSELLERMENVSKEWLAANGKVPCAVYEPEEAETVDRLVTLIHGKAEEASRDVWTSVAKARHHREKGGASEYGLLLLEKYLAHGKNLNDLQRDRWSGDYPLTVLNELVQKSVVRFGSKNSKELADSYPKIKFRNQLEEIIRDIGLEHFQFKHLRSATEDFLASEYDIPPPQSSKRADKGSNNDKGDEDGPKPAGNSNFSEPESDSTPNVTGTKKKPKSAPLNVSRFGKVGQVATTK